MADATDNRKASIVLPWPAIVATLAAVGGVFVYLNPPQTARPIERAGFHSDLERAQDVDARLWQDPLRTTSEHETEMQKRNKDSVEERELEDHHHSVRFLVEQVESR